MIEFDFISDDRFRESLAADYAEYRSCVSGEAWKAALVLVGAIVEAILVDHLIAAKYQQRTKTDPLRMQLGDLITACQSERILSSKTAALSTVIQGYRNLIHPGRSVRVGENPSKSAAIVAGELLQMIVEEISANRRARYGYTADQIVKKLERDESAMSIHKHLLKEVSEPELERLLLKVIPKRYLELDSAAGEFEPQPDWESQARLSTCFRSAFDIAPEETKRKVTTHFLTVLKEEDQHTVYTYETAFFTAYDLKYVSSAEAKLVKDHLLSRAKQGISNELLRAVDGIAPFLEAADVSGLVDALVRTSLKAGNPLKDACRSSIHGLWLDLPKGDGDHGLDRLLLKRLDTWITFFEEQENHDSAAAVREIREICDDIPF